MLKQKQNVITNKIGKTFTFLIILLIIPAITSYASTITKIYSFDEPGLITKGDFTKLQLEDGVSLGNPGEPEIPYIGIKSLLPQNESIVNVSLTLEDEVILGSYTLYPKQQQFPLSKIKNAEFTKPDPDVYHSLIQFPSDQHTDYNTHYLSGYSIGFFALTPIKYIPVTGELSYYKEIVVSIETEYDEAANTAGRFLHENQIIEKRLQSLVDNYEEIDNYYTFTKTKTRDEETYDYIIVTSSDYVDDFQPLADFHSHRGFRTKIELISDIYSNYTGYDYPDIIRNYFIDQYSLGPIKFVLLGGDTDLIPHRGFYANPGYGSADYNIPADMYYACLDRTPAPGIGPDWNNNNDNKWGEPNESDLMAEFYIGRVCMNNSTEIANVINKMTLYSETPICDELKSALLVGELLWGPPDYPFTYGGSYMNELIDGSSNNGYTTVGIPLEWDIATLYEMSGNWNSYDLFNQLNQGPNLLCHLGHSNVNYCLSIESSDLTTSNITNNGINANFINGYSQGCYAGSMDNRTPGGYYSSDCFAERISTMETAASTFIANSRYGWGDIGGTNGASQVFNREWIDVFFDDGIYSISGANQLSKEHAIPFIIVDQVIRWCCYQLNVFGDPSLELWTDEPTTLAPTYPSSIMAGTPEIIVTAPAYSRITIYDDDNIYGYGMTNFLGITNVIFDVVPEDFGIIHISIIGHNYYPYTDDITVTTSVANISPDTINVCSTSSVTIEVLTFSPEGTTPEEGVNVWAEGLDYISETAVTDSNGIANLSINYQYGPTLNIYGQQPGVSYYLFQDFINIIADNLTNPNISVTTEFGLTDTFGLNLPGIITAYVEEEETTLWINYDNSGFFSTISNLYLLNPSTMNPVFAIISKQGYNLYQEEFPVVLAYGTVSGIVTDIENSNPVSNAEVRFYELGGNPTEPPLFSGITNANGYYEITDEHPVNYYDIYVDKWGFNSYEELDYLLSYGQNFHDICLEPLDCSEISGTIWDDNGFVNDATLTYYRSDNGDVCATVEVNNLTGEYIVTLPDFSYDIQVTSPEHFPYIGSITVNSDETIDYHLGFVLVGDDCENGLALWISNSWQDTEEDYVSPTHSFTESPEGNYSNLSTNVLQLAEPIDLSSTIDPVLYFNTKWEIESNWDYAQVLASVDGSIWTALHGDYTEPGTGTFQPNGEPVYDGTQLEWVFETSDLSAFAGVQNVYLRFLLRSNITITADGWYIDDIVIGDPNSSYEIPIVALDNTQLAYELGLSQNYPNPVINSTTISFNLKEESHVNLSIYNIKGELVATLIDEEIKPNNNGHRFIWDGKSGDIQLANGIYFYKLSTNEKTFIKKMILLR